MSSLNDLWEGEHLSDAALLRFMQGTLTPDALLEADAHLFSCQRCQARLHRMLEENNFSSEALVALTQAFSRESIESPLPRVAPSSADAPDFEAIANYVDGTLAPDEAAAFEVALTRFPGLVLQVAELRELRRELHSPAGAALVNRSLANQASGTPRMAVPQMAVPAMIVPKFRDRENSSSRGTWWKRLVWPLQTLGATGFAALVLIVFGIAPVKEQLAKERANRARVEQEFAAQQESRRQWQQDSARSQREATQQRQKTRKAEDALKAAQDREKHLQAINEEQSRQLKQQQDLVARKREPIERAGETRPSPLPGATQVPTAPPAAPVRPTPQPARTPNTPENGADSQVAQSVQSVLASALANLRTRASGSRGEEKTFYVLSPVATRVKDVQPLLRWEKVPDATSYRIKLIDGTDDGDEQVIYDKEVTFQTESPSVLSWRVSEPLVRGHNYRWEVKARKDGHDIARATQRSHLMARFEVLSDVEFEALQDNLKNAGDSLLKRAFILAGAGLKDEAEAAARQLEQHSKSR